MKVSGSDPTRRSRGGRRHSGAPGGGVPARHAGAFTEVPDYEVAPIGAPLPHASEGKENEGAPRADQTAGAMTHACMAERCLKTESEMSARWRGESSLPWRGGKSAQAETD